MRRVKQWLVATGACALTAGAGLAAPGAALAQDGAVAPVMGVHQGTCADFTPEPTFDFGEFALVPIAGADDDTAAGTVNEEFGDDGIFDVNDEGYLADDIDGDGGVEIGLDDDEVFGDDLNDDAILTEDEVLVVVAPADDAAGMVWKVDQDVDASGEELINEGPYVMVVHESAETYDTLLACGEVLDLVEEGTVVVPLRPVGDSNYTGVALVEEDDDEYAGYLFQGVTAPGTAAQG